MRACLLLLFAGCVHAAPLPAPWKLADLGTVGTPGRATFEDGEWLLEATGADMWGPADSALFLYQPLKGDGQIVCKVDSLDAAVDWAKCGLMIRGSLKAEAPYAMVMESGANACHLQWREQAGGDSQYTPDNKGESAPYWLKLVRDANRFTGYCSRNAHDWAKVGQVTLELGAETLVGVAFCSHDNGNAAKAVLQKLKVGD